MMIISPTGTFAAGVAIATITGLAYAELVIDDPACCGGSWVCSL